MILINAGAVAESRRAEVEVGHRRAVTQADGFESQQPNGIRCAGLEPLPAPIKKGNMKKAKYTGNVSKEQINWGGNTDPSGILKEGEIYNVVSIEVHSYHTRIFLEGKPGYYNSVWFDLND